MLNTNARRWLNLIVLTAMLLTAIPFDPRAARAATRPRSAAEESPALATNTLPGLLSEETGSATEKILESGEAPALSAAPAEHPLLGPNPAPAADDALPVPQRSNPAAPQQDLADTPDWTSHEADDVRDMALGDFDLDGDLDLATAASDAPVRVFVNDDGTLPVNATWTAPYTETAYAISWADANGDGYLDLAVGNDGANRLYVYSPTVGSLVSAWTSAASEATRDLAWADWDGDGDPDLAVANDDTPAARVYVNENGVLTPASWFIPEASTTRAVAWGDWNDDDKLDLAVGGAEGLRVYQNTTANGLGAFQQRFLDPTLDVNTLAWGDFDADGNFDLAVGTTSSAQIYESTGSDLSLIHNTPGAATSVAWEDHNRDGWLDVAATGLGALRVLDGPIWYEDPVWAMDNLRGHCLAWGDVNNDKVMDLLLMGNTSQMSLGWNSPESEATRDLAWADWDGDGDQDLAATNWGGPNRMYRNDDGTLNLAWSSPKSDDTQSIAWGDWDGDGDPDLAVGNWKDPNRVYRNDDGTLTLDWSSIESDATTSVAWADWDDDGDLDLAVGNRYASIQVYRNDGVTMTLVLTSTDIDGPQSIAWGDWDNDGDPDLAVGDLYSSTHVYRNNGGTLDLAWSSPESGDTRSVAWADWDGDGDLDLAAGNREGLDEGSPNRVYRNDGGTLTLAWSSPESDETQGIAWGDWDNDGDPDLAVGNRNGPTRVYHNSGGALTLAWSSLENDYTWPVIWRDWDGDGYLDLAVGNTGYLHQGAPDRVYRNNLGDARRTMIYYGALHSSQDLFSVWSSSESRDSTKSVAWGDWDGDGDSDLAVGNNGGPNNIYRNDDGELKLVWSSPESKPTASIAWNDWDSDDDLDLLVANHRSYRVYYNSGGTFSTGVSADFSRDCAYAVGSIWSDWNGDGLEDLLIWEGDYGNGGFCFYIRSGDRLNLHSDHENNNYNLYSAALGDYDQDGDQDIAIGDCDYDYADEACSSRYSADSRVRIYRNDDGNFTLAWTSPADKGTTALSWSDYDEDGDLDLTVGNYLYDDIAVTSQNQIYRNEGNDVFSLAWTSAEEDNTESMTWEDWDNDGDLDLAVGNGGVHRRGSNRVYRNDDGILTLAWTSPERDRTTSLDWGDWDGDGIPDLAVGNSYLYFNQVYRSVGGVWKLPWHSTRYAATYATAWGDADADDDLDLAVGNYNQPLRIYEHWLVNIDDQDVITLTEAWATPYNLRTQALSWGDSDGDGDLDLAVAINGRNRLYETPNTGVISLTQSWQAPENENSYTLAWGDWDGDSDLDLVVGNYGQPNRLYRNQGGTLTSTWTSAESDATRAVAWGDYDGDGDPDLAVGNDGVNRIYHNREGALSLVWTSAESDDTAAIAWGDYDADGDLDLLAGNDGQPNWGYRNDGGDTFVRAWNLPEWDNTRSVDWGDWDGDGDLDILAGNAGQANRLYLNRDGDFGPYAAWSSSDVDDTTAVQWAEIDSDGDLDVAVGNDGGFNRVYETCLSVNPPLPNSPTRALVKPMFGTLDGAAAAPGIHSARVAYGPTIPITFTLIDAKADPVTRIDAYYSLNGGGQWLPATITSTWEYPSPTTDLATASGYGREHYILWDALADGVRRSDTVVFRIVPHSDYDRVGPITRPAYGANSAPFRVHLADLSSSTCAVAPSVASPGETLTYTLVLSNADNVPAPGVDLTWHLPKHTTFITATASQGAPSEYRDSFTWELLGVRWQGTISPTEQITLTIAAQLDAPLDNGTRIVATASRNGQPLCAGQMAATVQAMPDFAASTLVVTPTRAQPTHPVTYTAALHNQGDMHAPSAWYSDTLPADVQCAGPVQPTPNLGAGTCSDGVVQWYGPLTVGLPITLTYPVQLDDLLPIGTRITNTARLSDGVSETVVLAAPAVTVYSQPTLDTTALSAPSRVRPGDPLTYTLRMANTGTMHAPNSTASGPLPAGTTCGGSALCTGDTLNWSGALNVRQPVTLTYAPQVASILPAGTSLTHTVTVIPTDFVTNTITRTVVTTVTVPALDHVDSTLAVDKPIAMLGETVAFTLTLRNDAIDAPTVTAVITLPDHLAYEYYTALGGFAYEPALRQLAWDGPLVEGETIQLGFRAVVSETAPLDNVIDVVAGVDDGYNTPFTREIRIRAGVPDLTSSSKQADHPFVRVGKTMTYTYALINSNAVTANHVALLDPLPEAVAFASATQGISYDEAQHRLSWTGAVGAHTALTLTSVVTVSEALSDGLPIANTLYLADGAGAVYTRTATFHTVRPADSDCIDQVCVYGASKTDLGNGQWRFTGDVRLGSASRADVYLDGGGTVLLDENQGTITGHGRVALLANRRYPVLEGDFAISPDSGSVTPGAGATYLFDTLSGFAVPTDTGTLDLTLNVVQGTISGTAQIQSAASDLDIVTEVDFFVADDGNVDAVVGATTFQVWGQELSIEGGYLDSYGLVLNPQLTLPNEMATVDIPTFYVYPDGVFAGYVDFEQPVNVDLDGWGIALEEMVFDSDYGMLFPTSQITLPGGTTARLTDLHVNADGSIAYGNIQGDFDFDIAGFELSAHNATLSGDGLDVVSATLDFPFALTPESSDLALTFQDLRIGADGSVQGGGLTTNSFAFHFFDGWEVAASGLGLNADGVYIPRLEVTFPTDLGGRKYRFLNVGVRPTGELYGAMTTASTFNLGGWLRSTATEGFSFDGAELCAPELEVTSPGYMGRAKLYFDDVCFDYASGVKAGGISADFDFAVNGWLLEAARATLAGDQLRIEQTTLTIPALDDTIIQINDLEVGAGGFTAGSFASDIQAELFGMQVTIPHDKISLERRGVQIRELRLRLPSDLYNQEIVLSQLNASPDKITLRTPLDFEVGGLHIQARSSEVSANGFYAKRAKLALPSSLGNYRTNITDVRIDAGGFSIGGGDAEIKLPSFNVGDGNGLGVREAVVKLKFENSGYVFDGHADVSVPGMMAVDCRVLFGTPTPPKWPYELREASVHIYGGGFRVPVDATGIFITGIEGRIRMSDPVRFDLNFDYESAPKWIVHGDLGGWIDTSGQFGIHGSAIGLKGFIEAYAEISITRAQGLMGEFDFHTNPRILEGNVRVNLWSSDERTHFTASGRLKVQIPKGLLGDLRICVDIPELRCGCDGEWWEVWKCWCKIEMKRHCWGVVIPPSNVVLTRVGVDLGEFKNGKWGAKGTVEFFGIKFGLYIDTSGGIDVTNLDRYQLLEPPRSRMALMDATSTAETTERYVKVKENADGVIFALSWYTGTPTLSLVAPDGSAITSTVAMSSTTMHYELDSENHQIIYAVQDPQPGGWHLFVENPPEPDYYQLAVLGATAFPTITVDTPSTPATPADPTVTIAGQVSGVTTDTVLSLHTILTPTAEMLVTDESGITRTETVTVHSGRLLAEDVAINPDGSWRYIWDTTQTPRPDGDYHVYATIESERTPPVHAYAPGTVHVQDDVPPAPPAHLTLTPNSGQLALNWAPNTEPDLAGYLLAYRPLTDTRVITAVSSYLTNTGTITDPNIITDTRIISYTWGITQTVDVGNVIQYTLLGLDDDLDYAVTVRAYDLSGNLSAPTGATALVTETTPVVCTTPFTLEVPPVQEVTAGESAPITLTVRTTAQPSDSLCDFIQVSGQSPFSEAAQVYIEQSDLHLFSEEDRVRTRALLYAPPEAVPGDYTITFRAVGQSLTTTASTSLSVVPGAAHTVTVASTADAIPGDGTSSTTIAANVTDANGYPVVDGTEVSFCTNYGTLSQAHTSTVDGVAEVMLTSVVSGPVEATVTANADDVEGYVDVAFLWSDLIVTQARQGEAETQPGDMVEFAFAYGNIGNENASDVVISAVLPEGMEPVRFNSLGLMPQQSGDVPYRWEVPTIEAETAGLITVTAKMDPAYNWTNDQRVTVPIRVYADGEEYSDENNQINVQWAIKFLTLNPIGDRTIRETEMLSFTVSASAPESVSLTLDAEPMPPEATFDPTTGVFRWKPGYEDAGAYPITFTAAGDEMTDTETITITVVDTNRAPELDPIGDKTVREGETLTFTVSAQDPDGTIPVITAGPLPTDATLLDNTFTWMPDHDDAGVYPVTFTATSDTLTDTETITITVVDTNRAPELDPIGNKRVSEGETLTFTVSAQDPDGTIPVITAGPLPTDATFLDNTFTWMPDHDDAGVYPVTFTATSDTLTDTETITITVVEVDIEETEYLYLPLVLRSYRLLYTSPMVRDPVPEIDRRPVSERGETFYSTQLSLEDGVPHNGEFYFSNDPNQILPILVDDQLVLVRDDQELFSYTFSSTNTSPSPAIVEVPRQVVNTIAEGGVTLEYRDVYGSVVEASEVWLIWVP
jgi:uncharacterized repeat protein (TIGR01451 family)